MRRAVPLLASVATTLAVLATALPAHADVSTGVRFHADSGDSCLTSTTAPLPYGETDGSITWHGQGGPASYTWAQLGGTLTDRPVPSGTVDCRDDGRHSVATFIGWSGQTEAAVQTVTADNATVSFAFNLGGPTSSGSSPQSIDRITIQVCRPFFAPGPYVYCGKEVTYLAPPLV